MMIKTKKMLWTAAIVIGLAGQTNYALAEELPSFVLETMNVTAQGYEKTNLTTAADTEVYTAEELKKTGAHDVANALKYKSGIYFTNMGPHDQSWITGNSQTNLRGIDGGTLILINGVPASFNNVSHLDMMNLDAVERVEIVKGGGAVLYGSEALGGVINIITKNQQTSSIHIEGGNQGQSNYAATIGLGKAGLTVGRAKYGETGNMTEALGTKTINGSKVPYYIGFGDSEKDHLSFNYKFDEHWKFSYIYNKKDYVTNYNDVNENILQHFMYKDKEHFTQLAYTDQNGWDANAYYNLRKIDNPDYYAVRPDNVEWEKSEHKNYGINIKKLWQTEDATVLVGASIKRETYNNDNQKFKSFGNSDSTLKPIAHFGTYSLNEYSLYGSYERALSKVTSLTVSAREDIFKSASGDYNEFLPQVQAVTKLNKNSSLYASVGKSFRMPTFRNLYYASSVVTPNPNLKPERGLNYEMGYKYERQGDKFKAVLFKTEIEDQIVAVKYPDGISYQTNAAKYRSSGLELAYTKELDEHFTYSLGAIWANPERMYKEGQDWQRTLGKYQLNAGILYTNKDTDVALHLNYWGDRVKNGVSSEKITVTEIGSPLLLSNLHIGHRLNKNLTAALDIDNLFNRRDIANVSGTSNNNLYYTAGRTFRVGMTYNF